MAHKLADRIVEAVHGRHQLVHVLDESPELLKVARLQHAAKVDDLLHRLVLHLVGAQQTLAQREIRVRKIGECLQQDDVGDVHLQRRRIELVHLQNGQVRLEVVLVLGGLLEHVFLELGQMVGVVPVLGSKLIEVKSTD